MALPDLTYKTVLFTVTLWICALSPIGMSYGQSNGLEGLHILKTAGEREAAVSEQSLEGRLKSADDYRRAGSYEEALGSYQAVLSIEPSNLHALFWAATLSRWLGDLDTSEELYLQLLRIRPADGDAQTGLAYVLLFQNRLDSADSLVGEILERSPENHEALKVYARIQEQKGRYPEAVRIYSRVLELRPEDRWVKKRYHWLLEETRPLFRGQYRYSRAKILEGRGDPVPLEQIGYLTTSYELEGRMPLPRRLSLTTQFEQKRERLKLLELNRQPVNRTIYDFDTRTLLLGLQYQPERNWNFSGQGGITQYKDHEQGSVQEKKVGRLAAKIHYRDDLQKGYLLFRRDPFLGRSAGGDLNFRIFTRNQGVLEVQRKFAQNILGTMEATISHYSDDHINFEFLGALKLDRGRSEWELSVRKLAVQGRFLDPQLRLEFIDAYSIKLNFSRKFSSSWQGTGYVRYLFYEDHNQEQELFAGLEYRFSDWSGLSAGIEERVDHFNRDARQYRTLSVYSETTAYLKLRRQMGPGLEWDLKAMTSMVSDEGDSFYAEYGFHGGVEYSFGAFFKSGVRGRLAANSLDDLRQVISGYLLLIF